MLRALNSARLLRQLEGPLHRARVAFFSTAAEAGGGPREDDEEGPVLGPVRTWRKRADRFCTGPYEKPGEPRPVYPKRRSPFARSKALINALHEEEGLRMISSGRAVFPKKVPDPRSGDIITVTYAPNPNTPDFTRRFTGICISVRRRGLGSTFVLRNVLDGVPVERGFPFYSPIIRDAEVIGKRPVRRNKLYYLRGRKLRESTFLHDRIKK